MGTSILCSDRGRLGRVDVDALGPTPSGRTRSRALRRSLCKSAAGFSLVELVLAIAVLGILTATSIPFFVSYYRTMQANAGAQQVAAMVNQAREMAIQQAVYVCVQVSSTTQIRFYLNNTCTGTAWIGAGTDAVGNMTLPDGLTVAAPGDSVFDYLGAAVPAATYTVTNPNGLTNMTVTVVASGLVTVP